MKRYELSVPSFPLEKLKEYVEDGYFDDEVLLHLINELKGENKEALLNGEIKPYDCFELQILIRDLGWKEVYIDSDNYSDMDSETLDVVKKRIDMLFEQAKEECGITNAVEKDTPEEEMTIEEAIDQLKDLKKDREDWIEAGGDTKDFEKDIQAIDIAIKLMSGLILHKKGE